MKEIKMKNKIEKMENYLFTGARDRTVLSSPPHLNFDCPQSTRRESASSVNSSASREIYRPRYKGIYKLCRRGYRLLDFGKLFRGVYKLYRGGRHWIFGYFGLSDGIGIVEVG